MRTRIKFCGLTRIGDVRLAAELGVDALGFVFAQNSRRRIDRLQAAQLREAVPPLVASVALFMDNDINEVNGAIRALKPNWLQFHGREEEGFCRSFGLPYIKTLPMAEGSSYAQVMAKRYSTATAFLLDGHGTGQAGGRGETFNWSDLPLLQRPWLLAGGLRADNVGQAIGQTRPYAVDVSSGIEIEPGVKDGEKMMQFVQEVRRADVGQSRSERGTSD